MIEDAVRTIQRDLQGRADAGTREWWEAYLKGTISFRGVKMAGIRQAVNEWHSADGDEWKSTRQRELAIALIEQELAEDKLAGILLIQEILLPAGAISWRTELPRWARLFDHGFISDWNTCDWFCIRVLGPLAAAEGEACARAIADWQRARNLWRRRAAGVAFVPSAPDGEANFHGFTEMVLDVCATTIRHPERFAQTGTGWVLRELSKANGVPVAGFVERHLELMSREAVRMSVARLSDRDRSRLLAAHGADPNIKRGRR
ncbi:MAG: DNA alkylation repair protein [Acidimicrobiia bacterium]